MASFELNNYRKIMYDTDWDLLYKQKQDLLTYLNERQPIPFQTVEGLVNLLDFLGDIAEMEGFSLIRFWETGRLKAKRANALFAGAN